MQPFCIWMEPLEHNQANSNADKYSCNLYEEIIHLNLFCSTNNWSFIIVLILIYKPNAQMRIINIKQK